MGVGWRGVSNGKKTGTSKIRSTIKINLKRNSNERNRKLYKVKNGHFNPK